MTRRPLFLMAAGLALVLTAACGQQSDERVEAPTDDSVVLPSEVPSDGPTQSGAAAIAPFVTLDCTSLQVMPVDAPPASGTTVGATTAIFQPNGAPALTVATDAQPATELGIADITVGEGAEVAAGDTVTANYCGVGYGGKTVFDSSWTRGEPATFPLDGLIPGWQEGLPGMKVGGQRLLVIPGELAYGETGTQGIGPNETLAFVIQLESIS
jgi:peptidylprolyl isomerase